MNKWAVCALVTGVVLMVLSIILSAVIMKALRDGVSDSLSLKDKDQDADNYKDWTTNNRSDAPPKYWNIYLYKVINPKDVVKSAANPQVQEVGPYVYREYRNYYNTKFSDDKSTVSYNEQTWYEFQPSRSGPGLKPTDSITTVWPVGYEALYQAGGDRKVLQWGLAGQLVQAAVFGYAMARASSADPAVFAPFIPEAVVQWATKSLVKKNGTDISYISDPALMKNLTAANADLATILTLLSYSKLYPEYGKLTPQFAQQLLLGGPCPMFNSTADGVPCSLVFYKMYNTDLNQTAQYFGFPSVALMQDFYTNYADPTGNIVLTLLAPPNMGPFVSRSVDAILFHGKEDLLALAGQYANKAYFDADYPNITEAYAHDPTVTEVYTGQADLAKVRSYVRWKSMSVLPSRNNDVNNPGVWCHSDVKVEGHSDEQMTVGSNGVFGWDNGVGDGDLLNIFVTDVYRNMHFASDGTQSVKGVDTIRFRIDAQVDEDPLFDFQWQDVINMSCPTGGTHLFLTEPHFLNVNPGAQPDPGRRIPNHLPLDYMVQGVDAPDVEKHATYLDVEPITGSTIRGAQRLQLNYLMESPVLPNASFHKLVPILWVEEVSELTDQQASDIKDKIYLAIKVRRGVFLGLFFGGALLVALGIYLLLRKPVKDSQATGSPSIDDEKEVDVRASTNYSALRSE